MDVIGSLVHCIWKNLAIDKVVLTRKRVYLVNLANAQDKMKVLQRGVYFFYKKPFIVKAWNKALKLDTSVLQTLPIWVQFLEFNLKYWGMDNLIEFGSMLGIP